MGGQQSLCAAGLNPRVTALVVNEPAGADSNGPLHGRASGYPNWPSDDPQVMRTALYFDTVNCAMHIKAPSLVAMGFVDTTRPAGRHLHRVQPDPRAEAGGADDRLSAQQPGHARAAAALHHRSAEWLRLLVQGYNPLPAGNEPSPRTDANSLLAHEQLLKKAHSGHIDVYFLGDSITRRWGASDAQYAGLARQLEAELFGLECRRLRLGRRHDAEYPLAPGSWRARRRQSQGHRAHGGHQQPRQGGPLKWNDATAVDVVKGIRAILDVCRKKAPGARIVLMGVTPRNDDMGMMPVINAINARLARLADGREDPLSQHQRQAGRCRTAGSTRA